MTNPTPSQPKLLKGALVMYKSQVQETTPSIIVFQFNPEQLTRSLSLRSDTIDRPKPGAVKEEAQREPGPPVETINLTVHLNTADQLEFPDKHPEVVEHGLHPTLAALDMLMYPVPDQVQEVKDRAKGGTVQVSPPDTQVVLFVWGRNRVVPVRVTSISSTEEAFDANLNPIRAKVDLGLRVLTSMELKEGSIGHRVYSANQANKESLARHKVLHSAEEVTGLIPL